MTSGLRLQILLALAGVMLIAYVPLFFAIAQVTRGTSLTYQEEAARSLGRAIAAHVADVSVTEPDSLDRTIASHVGEHGALAIAVYAHGGRLLVSGGAEAEVAMFRAPSEPYGEASTRVMSRSGHALDIVLPVAPRNTGSTGGGGEESAVLVRVRAEDDPERTAQLVRGVALYMAIFALAILVFAYIALTRAIVRPIEQLARSADKVANGSRDLDIHIPSSGAREVADLGSSVRRMATSLIAEEKALRDKVDELTATTKRLGETREQLAGSERMASVGRLAAGVAHEIGNPIAAIMGMHDLMEDAETTDETRTDFLKRMRKETERIHVVVRDLLDYARPEDGSDGSGPLSTRPQSASVTEIIEDAVNLVRPQKDFKSIEIKKEDIADLNVAVSPQRLTQVLLNLLLNAGAAKNEVKATKTITIRVKKSSGPRPPRARIEIEDDGPGVPEDLATRIFDPFVTTKDVGAGTGLGLAVCRGIIEGAKGKIFVDLNYKNGARFIVDLPTVG
jgi:two-component system, NtrC family, sensor kinase